MTLRRSAGLPSFPAMANIDFQLFPLSIFAGDNVPRRLRLLRRYSFEGRAHQFAQIPKLRGNHAAKLVVTGRRANGNEDQVGLEYEPTTRGDKCSSVGSDESSKAGKGAEDSSTCRLRKVLPRS